MKLRQNITNIVNEIARGAGLDFELMTTYTAILNYCIKTNTLHNPRQNSYKLVNGCLFINNELIKRVEPLPARVTYDAAANYYENLILARAENDNL